MSPPEEPLQSLPSRVSAAEMQVADHLGGGNRSRGVRRALQLVARGAVAEPDARLSQLLERALHLAHELEAAAAADAVATPSGAVWIAEPSADLLLGVHQATAAAVLATPSGLMAFGKGSKGAESALAIDTGAGQLGITDPDAEADSNVSIDGTAALAALADCLAQAHHQARLASAQGKPIASAVAECPALRLRVRPDDGQGLAVVEVAGASIRLHPLAFLQLLAEVHSLLAREVARSVDQRQGLEQLLQTRPVVAGARTHGEG